MYLKVSSLASSAYICIGEILAGLVLCQGYIPEKRCSSGDHANRTQIAHLKQYIDNLTLYSV